MVGCGGLTEIVDIMKRTGAEDLGDFYPIRPDCQADTPKPRFKPRVGGQLFSFPSLLPFLFVN
jgi:hypothetical protein